MTSEIEKQFFDTFGIEPKIRFHCANSQTCAHTGFHCKSCAYHLKDVIYPQITDRILLELICLCPDLDEVFFTDVKELKETLLNSYINIYNYYATTEQLSDCERELKHQVHILFGENND